jgi:hypothetical protein
MTILIEAQLRNAIAAMKYALKTIDESNPAYSILQYSITTSDLALEVSEAGLPLDPVVKPAVRVHRNCQFSDINLSD